MLKLIKWAKYFSQCSNRYKMYEWNMKKRKRDLDDVNKSKLKKNKKSSKSGDGLDLTSLLGGADIETEANQPLMSPFEARFFRTVRSF